MILMVFPISKSMKIIIPILIALGLAVCFFACDLEEKINKEAGEWIAESTEWREELKAQRELIRREREELEALREKEKEIESEKEDTKKKKSSLSKKYKLRKARQERERLREQRNRDIFNYAKTVCTPRLKECDSSDICLKDILNGIQANCQPNCVTAYQDCIVSTSREFED